MQPGRSSIIILLFLLTLTLGMGPCEVEEFDLGVGAFEIGQDRAILSTRIVLGPGAILGSAADAFSYGLVEVFEDQGGPRLRRTARGNPSYAAGANDPNDVVDLFSSEMP